MLALFRTLFFPSKRATFGNNAIAICLVGACSLLWGIRDIPVTDRDEPRFAQATRQMLESETLGGWIIPKVGKEIRLKKPPLIYWAQAAVVATATQGDVRQDAIWMYRLTSVLAATIAALATCWIGRSMFAGNVGLLAGLLIIVCPVVVIDCHMARADELLLATTTVAMALLWSLWKQHRTDRARGTLQHGLPLLPCIGLWVFIALGILAKGPITPFVAGTAALGAAFARRDFRFITRLRIGTGVLVLLALGAPWLALAVREVGWETLRAAFDREVLQRAREGAEGHAAPPGYYLVTLVVFFFPGSLLVALAFGRLFSRAFAVPRVSRAGIFARLRERICSTRGRDAELMLFVWCVPTWLVFELIVTKFPHYILPIYPAIALFTARAIVGGVRALPSKINGVDRFGFGAWLCVGLCLLLAGPALFLALQSFGLTAFHAVTWPELSAASPGHFAIASIATALSGALLVAAWRSSWRNNFLRAMQLAVPATVIAEMVLLGVWLPQTQWIWNTPRLVGMMVRDANLIPSDPAFPRLGAVGYVEDSLIFTTRNRLDRLHDEELVSWMQSNDGGYLFVPSTSRASTLAAADSAGCALREIGTQRGFNYSDGESVDHVLYRVTRKVAAAPSPPS